MDFLKTSGIVIRAHPSGESDLVIRVLSEAKGKLSLFARGSRSSKRKNVHRFDIFDKGDFTIKPGRGGLSIVEGFIPHRGWRTLREDLSKLSSAATLCESLDNLSHEGNLEGASLYPILNLGLQAIHEGENLRAVLKSCFIAIAGILKTSGFLEYSAFNAPSANNLEALLSQVEEHSERELKSKGEIISLISTLKMQVANEHTN